MKKVGDKASDKDLSFKLASVWIPLLFLIAALVAFSFHTSFEEWDGVMQYFSGREIVSGYGYNGWPSHFWPPLYPLLVGLLSLVLPGFEAAKTVSLISGVLTLYIAFHFALALSGKTKVAILAQVFLFLNPVFFLSAVQAENHMLDALFFTWTLLLLARIANERRTATNQLVLLGIMSGISALSRYTSYSLVPVIIITILFLDRKKAALLCGAYLAGFIAVSLPWWIYNAKANGSPFHSWQYMNIGSRIFPDRYEWWWKNQENFTGLKSIIVRYPVLYLKNFYRNILLSNVMLLDCAGILTPLVLPAIFDSFISMKTRLWVILSGIFAAYIILVCQAFVFEQVFLSWSIILTILCVMFLYRYLALAGNRYRLIKRYRIDSIFIAILLAGALFITSRRIVTYVSADSYDAGQLTDTVEISRLLREHDPELSTKYLMAAHPARAYYAGSYYLMAPLYYEGTLEGLVRYRDLGDRVKEYAPKYPLFADSSDLSVDYLVYDKALEAFLPQFSFLLEEDPEELPNNFIPVYRSPEVAVYEIVK